MKKFTIYILLFVVSCAYNIETVKFIFSIIEDSSIICVSDFEENKSDKKESEKVDDEKKYFSKDFFFNHVHILSDFSQQKTFNFNNNYNISSSDFQKKVFSPPELL